MIEMESSSKEARVIKILLKIYPITFEELRGKLGWSEKALERVIKGLQSRGLISLEPLPDATYIRLSRLDFKFIGRKETQKKALKHKKDKKPKYKRKGDVHDEEMMYG